MNARVRGLLLTEQKCFLFSFDSSIMIKKMRRKGTIPRLRVKERVCAGVAGSS
jgi:hypothetical protein